MSCEEVYEKLRTSDLAGFVKGVVRELGRLDQELRATPGRSMADVDWNGWDQQPEVRTAVSRERTKALLDACMCAPRTLTV